ncbi:hormogonium polysaccharide biosynthesis protein HpsJ [Calothrix sp. 336/3]|uniref:hormogonium polysaccharide biosynthesis protein HpsJ n=1 Tax=Calothrix sp. 336/3 TaxID=1337936 RepID=UPI0004E2D18C|nr:HpsJ family protein [Calothrix sp. 336/3]AKG23656.1 hypothetical protein IJ00_22315 [Calothrix sp. 336/3]
MNNRFAASSASRTFKVVGTVLLLSFVLDLVILLIDFKPTDKASQIALASNLVERGIVPMVGLALMFAGYWVDTTDDSRSSGIDLRFPALILSSILGLMFFVIAPIHTTNVIAQKNQNLEQIRKDAEQAETALTNQVNQVKAQLNSNEQVKAELEKQKTQVKTQFSELLKDEERYKQALSNPNLPQTQKDLLKKFKANPQELDKYIAQQSDPEQLANQRLSQIRTRKEELEKQAESSLRPGMRIALSSWLLSIGYVIIGWSGLKNMGALKGSIKKATAR